MSDDTENENLKNGIDGLSRIAFPAALAAEKIRTEILACESLATSLLNHHDYAIHRIGHDLMMHLSHALRWQTEYDAKAREYREMLKGVREIQRRLNMPVKGVPGREQYERITMRGPGSDLDE